MTPTQLYNWMVDEGACEESQAFLLRLPNDELPDTFEPGQLKRLLEYARTPAEMWAECPDPGWLNWVLRRTQALERVRPAVWRAVDRAVRLHLPLDLRTGVSRDLEKADALAKLPPIVDVETKEQALAVIGDHPDRRSLTVGYTIDALCSAVDGMSWAMVCVREAEAYAGSTIVCRQKGGQETTPQLRDIRECVPEPPIPEKFR